MKQIIPGLLLLAALTSAQAQTPTFDEVDSAMKVCRQHQKPYEGGRVGHYYLDGWENCSVIEKTWADMQSADKQRQDQDRMNSILQRLAPPN